MRSSKYDIFAETVPMMDGAAKGESFGRSFESKERFRFLDCLAGVEFFSAAVVSCEAVLDCLPGRVARLPGSVAWLLTFLDGLRGTAAGLAFFLGEARA